MAYLTPLERQVASLPKLPRDHRQESDGDSDRGRRDSHSGHSLPLLRALAKTQPRTRGGQDVRVYKDGSCEGEHDDGLIVWFVLASLVVLTLLIILAVLTVTYDNPFSTVAPLVQTIVVFGLPGLLYSISMFLTVSNAVTWTRSQIAVLDETLGQLHASNLELGTILDSEDSKEPIATSTADSNKQGVSKEMKRLGMRIRSKIASTNDNE
ncbi:hypothetical protein BDK51DRAFT_47945 [Blyttiomyces helicus]|uniref:Uncharacterized protein n=1 Tax=Blyttiomyces helicus TaxID=388810 RepID=A0A4P9W1F7_9FUNG|nr:hypothetical protein BDK51DRAFT_47945 [Blyttiomyces helicus]|eukprot:RKO85492.1 hypothetical protein BDK51DRAFT_47945 [Blyttiomyces helicus]